MKVKQLFNHLCPFMFIYYELDKVATKQSPGFSFSYKAKPPPAPLNYKDNLI